MNRILQCYQLLYTIDKSYASVFFFSPPLSANVQLNYNLI